MRVTADGWEDVSVVIPEVRPRKGVTELPWLLISRKRPCSLHAHGLSFYVM